MLVSLGLCHVMCCVPYSLGQAYYLPRLVGCISAMLHILIVFIYSAVYFAMHIPLFCPIVS